MDNEYQKFSVAFHKAGTLSREAHLAWVRVVISILTPSLVLLIGLQNKNPLATFLETSLLVALIVIISITILLGLLLLQSESRGQHLLRDSIAEQWEKKESLDEAGIILPRIYLYSQSLFSLSSIMSIMILGIYGVIKYIP